MSTPRTGRKSGRSSTNLNHLSLAPLSSNKLTIDDDDDDAGASIDTQWRPTSYIAGKSAPTTPGILSRSSSTNRMSSQSYTHLVFADESLGLEKSKSTSILLHGQTVAQQKKNRRSAGSVRLVGAHADSGEWLFRAGTAISSEARESKGQSWLTTRASSTSLVAQDTEDSTLMRRSLDEDFISSARGSKNPSRVGSRAPSRAPSTRTSRRGSRSESRVDLSFYTPLASRTTLAKGVGGQEYFPSEEPEFDGPDFVDEEDDEIEDREAEKMDEEEIARLARDRGFGLGSLMDQLIGSTLFSVREDGEDTEDEDAGDEQSRRDEGEARRIRGASERVTAKSQQPRENVDGDAPGGWSDAAWLLSVATKVMF